MRVHIYIAQICYAHTAAADSLQAEARQSLPLALLGQHCSERLRH
jgi:hypothetical protein